MQSRRKSIIESITDIAIGYIIYLPINLFVLPLFVEGISEYSFWTALHISFIYTSIAIIRKYSVRRWFTRHD